MKRIKIIKSESDCGCYVNIINGKCNIDYCPKHKAAPELLEALKIAIKILQVAKCTAAVLNPLEDVLAKAEGKE